jgi:hypothetical protein
MQNFAGFFIVLMKHSHCHSTLGLLSIAQVITNIRPFLVVVEDAIPLEGIDSGCAVAAAVCCMKQMSIALTLVTFHLQSDALVR